MLLGIRPIILLLMLSLVIVAVADVKRGDAGRPHALACLLLSIAPQKRLTRHYFAVCGRHVVVTFLLNSEHIAAFTVQFHLYVDLSSRPIAARHSVFSQLPTMARSDVGDGGMYFFQCIRLTARSHPSHLIP